MNEKNYWEGAIPFEMIWKNSIALSDAFKRLLIKIFLMSYRNKEETAQVTLESLCLSETLVLHLTLHLMLHFFASNRSVWFVEAIFSLMVS